VQNYWLSAPYGRNWLYLWSSQHVPAWAIGLMVILFFGVLWAVILFFLGKASERHSWLLPIFAIGLGAPRWCQMLWSTSNIGLYVPWAGGAAASAIAGRSLWLWLGLLDLVQGVGYGMILLTTLTRFHIAFTLIAAQVLGSIATILGRATAPDRIGPGDVFPDFSSNVLQGLSQHWFWICLLFQLSTNVLCLMFFRKEQLAKP
jgi:alpha-1,3-glucan synthase